MLVVIKHFPEAAIKISSVKIGIRKFFLESSQKKDSGGVLL